MQYIMEHYGPAAVAAAIFLALGALIVALLAVDGTIAHQFEQTVITFFSNMQGVTG